MTSGRRRGVAAGLALAAAALLVAGAQSEAWWSGTDGSASVGIGLRSVSLCLDGACTSSSPSILGLGDAGATWARAALGASVGAILAVFLLVVLAVAVIVGRLAPLYAKVVVMANLAAAAAAATYVIAFPGYAAVSMGWSAFVFFAGCAAGAAAGAVSHRTAVAPPAPARRRDSR